MHPDELPDGSPFASWEDVTDYRRDWHVACGHPAADDGNPGSADRPLRTIQAAADRVQPRERVVVHAGVYRECVVPPRGGTGPEAMIAYVAAAGEKAIISGSEVWEPLMSQGSEWRSLSHAGPGSRIWLGELPRDWFRDGNPFAMNNLGRSRWFPWQKRPLEELERTQLRRGMLFADGVPLRQLHESSGLFYEAGTFWVRDDGLLLAVRLPGDAGPDERRLEVTARSQCFAPREPLGWIRVEGLIMEHVGNGVPFPQRGALSTAAGHHWVIAHTTIRHANAVGMDIGLQQDLRPRRGEMPVGGHVVRGNTITDCGITGICGCSGVDGGLIEGNTLTRIGGLDLEHCYEAAAIKVHGIHDAIIRGNRVHDCAHACGIWLDFCCGNTRVTGNRIRDIATVLAGIYIEANPAPILVDRNVVMGMRDEPRNDPPKDGIPGGMGISSDISEKTRIENNLVVDCTHYAIACHRAQEGREVNHYLPDCKGMAVRDNLVVSCQRGVLFTHGEGNAADGNIYGQDTALWRVKDLGAGGEIAFAAWRAAGFDEEGAVEGLVVERDGAGLRLILVGEGCPAVDRVRGPLEEEDWRTLMRGEGRWIAM